MKGSGCLGFVGLFYLKKNIMKLEMFNNGKEDERMSSREIAEITGKRHDHVLRDCDKLNENYEKLGLPKIGEGQNRLFEWLRAEGYLGKFGERKNIPNQKYIEMGLFELKKGVRSGNDGVMRHTITTKVTGKGQVFFVNKFLSDSDENILFQ